MQCSECCVMSPYEQDHKQLKRPLLLQLKYEVSTRRLQPINLDSFNCFILFLHKRGNQLKNCHYRYDKIKTFLSLVRTKDIHRYPVQSSYRLQLLWISNRYIQNQHLFFHTGQVPACYTLKP